MWRYITTKSSVDWQKSIMQIEWGLSCNGISCSLHWNNGVRSDHPEAPPSRVPNNWMVFPLLAVASNASNVFPHCMLLPFHLQHVNACYQHKNWVGSAVVCELFQRVIAKSYILSMLIVARFRFCSCGFALWSYGICHWHSVTKTDRKFHQRITPHISTGTSNAIHPTCIYYSSDAVFTVQNRTMLCRDFQMWIQMDTLYACSVDGSPFLHH